MVCLASFAVLAVAGSAVAGFRRQHASFCMPVRNSDWYEMTAGSGLQTKGIWDVRFLCPLLDDSKIDRGTIAYVNVHVNDTNRGAGRAVRVKACVQYWPMIGSWCGNEVSTTTDGPAVLQPNVDFWHNTNTSSLGDFAYIDVTLCQDCKLYGYFAGT
jgi:hypothetical protein